MIPIDIMNKSKINGLASRLLMANKDWIMKFLVRDIIQFLRSPRSLAILFTTVLGISVHSAYCSEAKDIVAIQLRSQGIPCANPSRAVRDIPDTLRDEVTWIITCKEAIYRVKLIPHVGSKVEVIENSQLGDAVTNGRE